MLQQAYLADLDQQQASRQKQNSLQLIQLLQQQQQPQLQQISSVMTPSMSKGSHSLGVTTSMQRKKSRKTMAASKSSSTDSLALKRVYNSKQAENSAQKTQCERIKLINQELGVHSQVSQLLPNSEKMNKDNMPIDSSILIRQHVSQFQIDEKIADKPYTEDGPKIIMQDSTGQMVQVDSMPDVLGGEATTISQEGKFDEMLQSVTNYSNDMNSKSITTTTNNKNELASPREQQNKTSTIQLCERTNTPSQTKRNAESSTKKSKSSAVNASGNKKQQTSLKTVAQVYDVLPSVKSTRHQQKNFQTMDRRQTKTKSTSVPHGVVKFHQVSNDLNRADKLKEKDCLLALANQVEGRIKGEQNSSQGRNWKNNSIVGTGRQKNQLNSNASQSKFANKKQQSLSPSLREKFEISQLEEKSKAFATNDYCMNTSVGLSSSVTSLPHIIHEDKQSNLQLRTQQRRFISQLPQQKFSTSKSSIGEQTSATQDQQQFLSYRLHVPPKVLKGQGNQQILSPIGGGSKALSQVRINKALKKSIKSSSVLKNVNKDAAEQQQHFPKLKKKVSIREHSLLETPSGIVSNSDSGSLNEPAQNQVKWRQGTPMSIIESNADNQDNEHNTKVPIPPDSLTFEKKHRIRDVPSKTLQITPKHYKLPYQLESKANSLAASMQSAEPQSKTKEKKAQDKKRDERSLSTTVRQSHKTLRNKSQQQQAKSVSNDNNVKLMASAEHQIRIEISKTEVLDSMKKEHQKDLSLLFYDFNNSKARLMSKMKKMSDFVIQEEAEADGDGVAAPHLDSKEQQQRKKPVIVIDDKINLSPISKKQRSPLGSEKTKSTLTKMAGRQATDSNKKSESQTENFGNAAQASSALKGSSFKFMTSQPAVEASSAIKQLDLPKSSMKNAGKLSTTDVTQIQTEMAFVNKKIDKAKQSISQLQNDGSLMKGMTLQSPARLVNSRNSSTNTYKQQASQLAGTPDLPVKKEASQQESPTLPDNMISSPSLKVGKKFFLFNQSSVTKENNYDARNRSPCFGSIKTSQNKLQKSNEKNINSIENIASLVDHYSHSLSSLHQQSHNSASKNSPFPQPQNHLVALSRRSDQSFHDGIVQTGGVQDGGCTGATGGELESTMSIQGATVIMKHGMGTGFQTSVTNEKQEYHRSGKKQRRNIGGNFNRRLPSLTLSSPAALRNQPSRRKSQDTSNGGMMNTESDYAMQSSQHEMMSERDSEQSIDKSQDCNKVHSVIAYVKENKQIWE